MKKNRISGVLLLIASCGTVLSIAETPQSTATTSTAAAAKAKPAPKPMHPNLGQQVDFGGSARIVLANKLWNYKGTCPTPRDPDIISPKSVNIHPSGKKFYVNSLEGAKTVVYSLPEFEKLAVINHRFDRSHSSLWAPPSGLFTFRHYTRDLNHFTGKPVESAFSHNGRYLWVPYYRRSFDLNAQDPSALAVIDTSGDTIVRVMEAGVLPKMIALSDDGNVMAVAHWGDNTVGLLDISSEKPSDWHYMANVVVGKQLIHDFSLTESVDRDTNTGEALRGTVFMPDNKYVLVGCMGGGGIAVIDIESKKYLGKILGLMPNVRHLLIKGDWLYASINAGGYVQRTRLERVEEAIARLKAGQSGWIDSWQKAKVGAGARTIAISPAGDYIFAACNFGSRICVVDSAMNPVAEIAADSYPVGLDISPDGRWLISTSQGRNYEGGNCVDIYRLEGLGTESAEASDDATSLSGTPDRLNGIVRFGKSRRQSDR